MHQERSNVLIVDDDPVSSYTLQHFLERTYSVRIAEDGINALKLIQDEIFDLIILDVILPDIDGYGICRNIKSQSLAGGAPIIFISSIGDTKGKLDGFAAGGVDYITKPFVSEEVMSRVATQIDLHHLRRSLEERVKERTRSLEAEIERRRIAETALRKLSTAVVQAPLTVMIVGTSGLIEYVNPSFTSSTGYTVDEVIGKNPRFLKSGYTTPDEYTALWDAITSGEVWRGEFCTVRKKRYQILGVGHNRSC